MPILIKKVDASLISYLDEAVNTNFSGGVILIRSVIGQIGLEDYFIISNIEGFTQNFSSVSEVEFCETNPNTIGPTNCPKLTELNISF